MNTPLAVPREIVEQICLSESKRLEMDCSVKDVEFAAYFQNYSTCTPGYHGPLVVVVWGGDPGATSTFYRPWDAGIRLPWQHCNSSAW